MGIDCLVHCFLQLLHDFEKFVEFGGGFWTVYGPKFVIQLLSP